MSGKKFLIILGALAAVSFALSAGVGLFFGGAKPSPAGGKSPAAVRPPTKSEALLAGLAATGERPPAKVSHDREQVEGLIKDLRVRMSEYERKERKLLERKKRVALAEQNLRRRAKELETLRMELVGPLMRLKNAVAELDSTRVVVAKEEKVNLQRIAATYEKIPPERGATILADMCDNGQTDDVVKILFYMNERCAGKLLGEMAGDDRAAKPTGEVADKGRAAELTKRMQRIREGG